MKFYNAAPLLLLASFIGLAESKHQATKHYKFKHQKSKWAVKKTD